MALGKYVQEFFTNWREYEAPATAKIRLTLRNRARATRRMVTEGKGCCGHYGEPGC